LPAQRYSTIFFHTCNTRIIETKRTSRWRCSWLFLDRWCHDSRSDFLGSEQYHQKMEKYANAAGFYFYQRGKLLRPPP